MRLFPTELEITETEGFTAEKDLFGLKDFGDRLTRIVRNLDGPAVLLLDSPQGTGKTTFIKMWRGELSKASLPSIYFDAFANDYLEDAFLAIAGEIIARAEELKPRSKKALATFKSKALEAGKVLARGSLRLALRAGSGGLLAGTEIVDGLKIGSDVAKAIGDEAAKVTDDLLKQALEGHAADRKIFQEFQDSLAALSQSLTASADTLEDHAAPKLIFIIDELDRCKPPFSLDLLEKIKHFFSVPNVIFVLSSNVYQLEQSVKNAYGDIDARSYLEKFFHVRILLPTGTPHRPSMKVDKYLGHLFKNLPQAPNADWSASASQFLAAFSHIRPISLRTLERTASYIALSFLCLSGNNLFPSPLISGLAVMKVIEPTHALRDNAIRRSLIQ